MFPLKTTFTSILLALASPFINAAETAPEIDALNLGAQIQPLAPEGIFKDKEWFNWGCSVIKGEDGRYYNFYSRWPHKKGFSAWLTHSEIALAVSDKATGPWKYVKTVLKGRGQGHWDDMMAHNPKIKKFNGKYYLYYIASQNKKNRSAIRNSQRTGVAISDSLLGPWELSDKPIITPQAPVYTVTVNPAVLQKPDGKYMMIIKGDSAPPEKKKTGFHVIQGVAFSDTPEGPWKIHNTPAIKDIVTEDVSVWYDSKRKSYYAVFHVHGKNYIGMITSKDGFNWSRAKHFKVCPKQAPLKEGGILKVSRFERPFVYLNEKGEAEMIAFAVKKGNSSFSIYMELKETGE